MYLVSVVICLCLGALKTTSTSDECVNSTHNQSVIWRNLTNFFFQLCFRECETQDVVKVMSSLPSNPSNVDLDKIKKLQNELNDLKNKVSFLNYIVQIS